MTQAWARLMIIDDTYLLQYFAKNPTIPRSLLKTPLLKYRPIFLPLVPLHLLPFLRLINHNFNTGIFLIFDLLEHLMLP